MCRQSSGPTSEPLLRWMGHAFESANTWQGLHPDVWGLSSYDSRNDKDNGSLKSRRIRLPDIFSEIQDYLGEQG